MTNVALPTVGTRVRRTYHYPERGPFCPAGSYTYEGKVARVRDLAADAREGGYPEWEARRLEGEYHVTLADVTVTPSPAGPLARVEHQDTVVLAADHHPWEVIS